MKVCRTLATAAALWTYRQSAPAPHVLTVDLSLPRCSGLTVVADMRKQYPGIKLLVVSMHEELTYIQRAVRAGAKGYVTKRESPDVLIDAIRAVMSDQFHISPIVLPHALRLLGGRRPSGDHEDPVTCLSNRELEVMQHIAAGRGTREIAQRLNLSVNTIATHRRHIREKRCLSSGDLLRFAVQWSLEKTAAE